MGLLPPREDVALRYFIERNAAQRPHQASVIFENLTNWTWRRAREVGRRTAHWLAARGIAPGDHVLVFLPNGPEWLAVWFGAAIRGAVLVPVNTGYRGEMLKHLCVDSRAPLIVTDKHLAPRLEQLSEVEVEIAAVELGTLLDGPDEPMDVPPTEPWHTASINYTSGTTGPSKGVIQSHMALFASAQQWLRWAEAGDTMLNDLPLFHVGGQSPALGFWSVGGRLAIRSHFVGRTYLDHARAVDASTGFLVGSMGPYLLSQPSRPDDADTPLQHLMVAPMIPDSRTYIERFGLLEAGSAYALTEAGGLFYAPGEAADRGSCGRPRPGVVVRLADDHDDEVEPGESGELLIRSERPWELMTGYLGRPEETARIMRNGWLHTGDELRMGDDGWFYFVDRVKDAIRRRGENISSFEVEREVAAHPSVEEVAAIAVRSELAEDEVMVSVVPTDGTDLDPVDLLTFLAERMPHFMVPRYIDIVPELPKTDTQKVRKHVLRDRGVTPTTWDREQYGMTVKRDGTVQRTSHRSTY